MARGAKPIEQYVWPDVGCRVHPSCLSCPLPACIFDISLQEQIAMRREAQVAAMTAEGKTNEQIAEAMGISKRSVYRLRALRGGQS